MSDQGRRTIPRGGDHSTAAPVFSIAVTRAMGTVVVTLEGLLDEESSSRLASVLADLIENQGNLSVSVDALGLTQSDPGLAAVFAAAKRAAANRGGTLTMAVSRPPEWAPSPRAAATAVDARRAGRHPGSGMADHPAGGARTATP